MQFRMLGALEAQRDGLPVSLAGPKQRSVLAMLLLDANRVVSTDRLVDGLWGATPPLRASATLHVYVSNLRKVFGEHLDEPNEVIADISFTLGHGEIVAIVGPWIKGD